MPPAVVRGAQTRVMSGVAADRTDATATNLDGVSAEPIPRHVLFMPDHLQVKGVAAAPVHAVGSTGARLGVVAAVVDDPSGPSLWRLANGAPVRLAVCVLVGATQPVAAVSVLVDVLRPRVTGIRSTAAVHKGLEVPSRVPLHGPSKGVTVSLPPAVVGGTPAPAERFLVARIYIACSVSHVEPFTFGSGPLRIPPRAGLLLPVYPIA